MKISEEIQQMLDDHLILTQQISFSPYKAAFEDRIDEWENKLKITSQVIEEWMEVQKYVICTVLIFNANNFTEILGSGCI